MKKRAEMAAPAEKVAPAKGPGPTTPRVAARPHTNEELDDSEKLCESSPRFAGLREAHAAMQQVLDGIHANAGKRGDVQLRDLHRELAGDDNPLKIGLPFISGPKATSLALVHHPTLKCGTMLGPTSTSMAHLERVIEGAFLPQTNGLERRQGWRTEDRTFGDVSPVCMATKFKGKPTIPQEALEALCDGDPELLERWRKAWRQHVLALFSMDGVNEAATCMFTTHAAGAVLVLAGEKIFAKVATCMQEVAKERSTCHPQAMMLCGQSDPSERWEHRHPDHGDAE